MSNRVKTNLLAIITIFIWATAFPVTRMIGDEIAPSTLALTRCIAASVLLLVVGMISKIHLPKGIRQWVFVTGAAITGFAVYIIFFSKGLHSITSSTSSVIIATVPIMVAVGARVIYKEKISLVGWITIGTAFCGVVILMCWNGVMSINVGALWTLGAAICFFIYNLLNRSLSSDMSSLEIVTFAMVIAAILLAIFYGHQAIVELPEVQPYVLIYAVYLGFFPSAVSYFLWGKALELAEKTSEVTNYMFVTPVLSTILGLIMLHEVPDAGTFIGGAIIIASVIVFNLKK